MLLQGRWKEPSDRHFGKLTAHAYALCARGTTETRASPLVNTGTCNRVRCVKWHTGAGWKDAAACGADTCKPALPRTCDTTRHSPELVRAVGRDKDALGVDDLVQHDVHGLFRDGILLVQPALAAYMAECQPRSRVDKILRGSQPELAPAIGHPPTRGRTRGCNIGACSTASAFTTTGKRPPRGVGASLHHQSGATQRTAPSTKRGGSPQLARTWTTNCVLFDTLYMSEGVQNSDVVSLPRMHICAEHRPTTAARMREQAWTPVKRNPRRTDAHTRA